MVATVNKMFKKLVSNLPFNPSLISQVSFYSKRLKKENSIRRMGVFFISLSFLVQMLAVISPAQQSLASSENDVIRGGFSSKSDAVAKCNANVQDYKTILGYLGITCGDLDGGTVTTVGVGDYGGQLYSMGRQIRGSAQQVTVDIPGLNYSLYMRPLTSVATSSRARVISGTSSTGKKFFVIISCGNPVTIGKPQKPTPPPPPPPEVGVACNNLSMSVANKETVEVGTTISFNGKAVGKNVKSSDLVDMYYEMVNKSTGQVVGDVIESRGNRFAEDGPDNLRYSNDAISRVFTMETEGDFEFRLVVKYESGSKTAIFSRVGNCKKEVTVEKTKTCEESEETICLRKEATNETQNQNANGLVARPGDVITYRLYTKNVAKQTAQDYVVKEMIEDVLEYADITDYHGGELQTLDGIRYVVYPPTNIEPDQEIENKITIKVKKPIPSTNSPESDPQSYDLLMTNVYGNTINIPLRPTTPKRVEKISKELPNTGPGETLAAGFAVAVIAGYFLARSKLLRKELELVKEEFTSGAN